MELKEILPYIVAILSGLSSWVGSYIMATKKSKQELKTLEESNKHEIDKLMKQHEIDLESIKEKHKLEMENKNAEHEHKIEVIELEHRNKLAKIEQEHEASAKYGAIEDLVSNPDKLLGLLEVVNNPKYKKFIK